MTNRRTSAPPPGPDEPVRHTILSIKIERVNGAHRWAIYATPRARAVIVGGVAILLSDSGLSLGRAALRAITYFAGGGQ